MRLRARKARPSVSVPSNSELVRAMTYRMYGAFIASLSVVALLFGANETFARPGASSHGGMASTHSTSHRSAAHSFRHHRRNNNGIFWPAIGDFYYGPPNGEPMVDLAQPIPGDIRDTQAYAVPWDWAHRYPPIVTPSERPYVPNCPTETVTVPGHNGGEQTVNVMRCF